MKIKENKENKTKKLFEPFSFTMEVQTEEELLELYHRFNFPSGKLLKLYTDQVPPTWTFVSNNCEDVKSLLMSKLDAYNISP